MPLSGDLASKPGISTNHVADEGLGEERHVNGGGSSETISLAAEASRMALKLSSLSR